MQFCGALPFRDVGDESLYREEFALWREHALPLLQDPLLVPMGGPHSVRQLERTARLH